MTKECQAEVSVGSFLSQRPLTADKARVLDEAIKEFKEINERAPFVATTGADAGVHAKPPTTKPARAGHRTKLECWLGWMDLSGGVWVGIATAFMLETATGVMIMRFVHPESTIDIPSGVLTLYSVILGAFAAHKTVGLFSDHE